MGEEAYFMVEKQSKRKHTAQGIVALGSTRILEALGKL
jgi:hypothetical protein